MSTTGRDDGVAAWRAAVAGPLAHATDADAHWQAFQQAYRDRDPASGPPPAWLPSAVRVDDSNLEALRREVGVADYGALHAWSVGQREAFWRVVAAAYGLRPAGRVREGDAEGGRWFPGTTWNAASMCMANAPGHVAVRIGGEARDGIQDVTMAELAHLAARVSRGLEANGLRPGDAVALYMPMDLPCVAAYLGIVQAGMVVVSIADSFAPEEVATRLRIAGARMMVCAASMQRAGKQVDLLAKARRAAGPARLVVVGEAALEAGELAWEALLGPPDAPPYAARPMDVDAATNILFSSGTTGEPKAIPWTHLSPLKAAMDGRYHQDIHAGDVVAWPTNIGWMMGPWLVYASLANGATMALWEGAPNTLEFLRFVDEAGVTMLGVVPALVRSWRAAGALPHCLPRVRTFSSTGEASDARDQLWLMSLASYRAPVVEYCGGTEVAGGHITGTVVQPQSPATFSTPALGSDFVVLDDEGAPVAPGHTGQLYLVPPSVGLSERLLNRDHHEEYYAGCPPGPNGQVLRRHGDAVARLHGGYWRAHGRADDTMNLGGIKVSSVELETVLNGLPGVRETAAVAVVPQAGGADRLVVFAVLEPGASSAGLKERFQSRLRERLNPLYRVHDVVVADALPRTASNKVMRRVLRARYDG